MATATKQARTSRRATRGVLGAPGSEPMRSFVVEDNGGDFHWTLLDSGGHSLARSPSFVSYQDAENAARVVLAGAASARLQPRVDTDSALDDVGRSDEAAARDETDAERWLDEGGGLSRKVARR